MSRVRSYSPRDETFLHLLVVSKAKRCYHAPMKNLPPKKGKNDDSGPGDESSSPSDIRPQDTNNLGELGQRIGEGHPPEEDQIL